MKKIKVSKLSDKKNTLQYMSYFEIWDFQSWLVLDLSWEKKDFKDFFLRNVKEHHKTKV